MQSFSVMLVYRTIPGSAFMPIHRGLEGLGSEGFTDATSNAGLVGDVWAKVTATETKQAQIAPELILSILAPFFRRTVRNDIVKSFRWRGGASFRSGDYDTGARADIL